MQSTPTVVHWGGGVDGNPPLEFVTYYSISKYFNFIKKPLIFTAR